VSAQPNFCRPAPVRSFAELLQDLACFDVMLDGAQSSIQFPDGYKERPCARLPVTVATPK
jgi:hypothetical protein